MGTTAEVTAPDMAFDPVYNQANCRPKPSQVTSYLFETHPSEALPALAMDKERITVAVYNVVRTIPAQKVTSCGHIAKLIGMPKSSKQVKDAVRFISHTTPPVPWHRVVSTSGIISTGESCHQRDILVEEGVPVHIGSHGESRVDFDQWGWFPSIGSLVSYTDSDGESEVEWGS
ncbi:hypothetical protein BV22DRAFT_1032676 [Leucogyrophana mollusca]|uniref:Uncharacterized protein n=1 Tax=Leucogyrophana mollusca TaxID=85980 RepID=A0ACB8BQ43_9AGAM|nr:hypothetical protein BV22DRAFT_1032676 [Leucogyrophana mollusca]